MLQSKIQQMTLYINLKTHLKTHFYIIDFLSQRSYVLWFTQYGCSKQKKISAGCLSQGGEFYCLWVACDTLQLCDRFQSAHWLECPSFTASTRTLTRLAWSRGHAAMYLQLEHPKKQLNVQSIAELILGTKPLTLHRAFFFFLH